ncbi:MAG: 4-demethylwyosine synthase TYW1, partial [Thermoplasmata archaeon]
PSHEQVMSFGKKLADKLGYFFANEKEDSRVVLLSKNKKVERINKQS